MDPPFFKAVPIWDNDSVHCWHDHGKVWYCIIELGNVPRDLQQQHLYLDLVVLSTAVFLFIKNILLALEYFPSIEVGESLHKNVWQNNNNRPYNVNRKNSIALYFLSWISIQCRTKNLRCTVSIWISSL